MHDNNVKMAAVADAVVFHKICGSNAKIFDQDRLPYKFIGYLNRFIDKKLFCPSLIYWKFWRFINLSYVAPKLIFIERYGVKNILYFVRLLIRYSNDLSEVNKELFFKAKELFVKNE